MMNFGTQYLSSFALLYKLLQDDLIEYGTKKDLELTAIDDEKRLTSMRKFIDINEKWDKLGSSCSCGNQNNYGQCLSGLCADATKINITSVDKTRLMLYMRQLAMKEGGWQKLLLN